VGKEMAITEFGSRKMAPITLIGGEEGDHAGDREILKTP